MLSTRLCFKMITKIIFFYLSVVLSIQCSVAENVIKSPTTIADLIATTQAVPIMMTTVETTVATTVASPNETPAVTSTTVNIATTLKPKLRKAHKRRKASKAAIRKYTELLDFTIAEVMSIADLTLSITKQLFKDVISDVSNHDDGHDDLVDEKIAVLKTFIAKTDEVQLANDTLGKLNLVEELDVILEKFNKTSDCSAIAIEDRSCAVDAIIYGAFKRHDFGLLEKQVEQRNLLFLENFKNAADKFWNSLLPKDQKRGRQFHQWLTEFKSAADTDTKFDYLWMWFDV